MRDFGHLGSASLLEKRWSRVVDDRVGLKGAFGLVRQFGLLR